MSRHREPARRPADARLTVARAPSRGRAGAGTPAGGGVVARRRPETVGSPPSRGAGRLPSMLRGVVTPRHRDRPAAGRGRERGSASIEFLGFLPILILVALAAVQLGIAAYAAQQAGTAARAAARTASLDEPRTSPQAAGEAAISGWLADGTGISSGGCGGGEAQATATVEIPSVIPGFDFGSAEKSATMPCDDGDGGDGGTDSPGAAAMGGDR
ncbi:TadE-like protein [Streptomyces melanosporofaciens]|uniref:TadE-like protein n=2 Tax=Streptomyces melanosporofaciens TaxID=67327 RepID=A0A1H4T6N2_STRMJ|nr:TadE-like protein [Streptomyces melanosporofaciens]